MRRSATSVPELDMRQCVNHDDKNLTNKQELHTHVSLFICAVETVLGLGGHVVFGVVLGFTTQTQHP